MTPDGEVFRRIRSACAWVAGRASFVRLDEERLESLTHALLAEGASGLEADPAHHRRASAEETLSFVLTLDAINFGSGWFPALRKRAGCSGYYTVALALADHFDTQGAWSAADLSKLETPALARILHQDLGVPDVAELLELYTRALHDLGHFLLEQHAGRFAGCVEAAQGSAARLVAILAGMPFYRDVAELAGRQVPFYKRAQITVADLRVAFDGAGPGRFEDADDLTLFADNLVPHVLRLEGCLVYAPELLARIQAGRGIPAGSPEEIEIRACAVHAVEQMAQMARSIGRPTPPWRLDGMLWSRGQRRASKAEPRHRTRTVFY